MVPAQLLTGRSAPTDREAGIAVARLAATQNGFLRFDQLARLGVDRRRRRRWIESGRLHPGFRGTCIVGHDAPSHEARCHGAVLACGDGAALCGIAAARLWRITRRRSTRIDVMTWRQVGPVGGVHVARTTTFPASAITYVDRIPVLRVEYVLVTLSWTMGASELCAAIHEAQFRYDVDLAILDRWVAAGAGRRGAGTVREALRILRAGGRGTESELEEVVLAELAGRTGDMPIMNLELTARGRTYRPDLVWRHHRLICEVDGSRSHGRSGDARRDARRDDDRAAEGWTTVRLSEAEIRADVARAVGPVCTALRARSAVRPRQVRDEAGP